MVTTDNNTTFIINQQPQEIALSKMTCDDTSQYTSETSPPTSTNTGNATQPDLNSIPDNYSAKVFYNLKHKRKRKLRNEPNEQSEYLEKMSVRGLDIQRYEHVVDGVAYCGVCAKKEIFKTFKNKYSFQRHAYLFHEGDNRKIFACPVCSKEFSRPDKMKMHKKEKHSEVVDLEEQLKAAAADDDKPAVTKTPVRRKRLNKAQKIQQQLQLQEQEQQQQQQSQSDNNQTTTTITTIIDANPEHNNSSQGLSNLSNSHQLQTIDLSNMILPSQLQISTAELLQHHQQQQQQQQQQQLQNATILYNQIDLNNALLQNQLHANNIIIQTPMSTPNGNLLPVQTIQTHNNLDGSMFHHQSQLNQSSSQPHIQIKNSQHVMTSIPLNTTSTTTLSSATSNSSHHLLQRQHQLHHHNNNNNSDNNHLHHQQQLDSQQQQQQQHHQQQQQQHHQMDMTSLTKLENVSYLPATNENNHVIGTVQSYQIITPDGLHAYQPKLINANEIELCPFTTASGGGGYTFATASTSQSNNNTGGHSDQPQFMDIKNELLIKGDQFMDTTGLYHLPFSPNSMINAVSDVNGSSMLETKEIRSPVRSKKRRSAIKH